MNERIKRRTMGWVSDILLIGLLFIIGAAVLSTTTRPAKSAEVCDYTYDSVLAFYESFSAAVPSMGETIELSGEHKAAAIAGAVALGVPGAERATRVFRAPSKYGAEVYTYGLEVDGCLLEPVYGTEVDDAEGSAPTPKLDSTGINA